MIEREEVEALLFSISSEWRTSEKYVTVRGDIAAELARTWLRVNEAPVGVVRQVEGPYRDERVLIKCNADGVRVGNAVRLVPEADSGGEG